MKKKLFAIIACAAMLAGCGNNNEDFVFTNPQPAQAQAGVTHQQVEFLARPAIGEGLLFSNALLNTYNAVGPSFVAAALADPSSAQGQAAAPILEQASAVLDILTNLDGDPNDNLTTAQIVGAFLPDVMRIDTTLNVPVDTPSYAFAQNAHGSVVGGRKLTDDVIDISLTVLTGGVVTSDGVPYYRPDGVDNPNDPFENDDGTGAANVHIGHHRLNGQATDYGTATFPFLAPAN
jgi:hypothetical protein